MKLKFTLIILSIVTFRLTAQHADTLKTETFSIHAQATVINQNKTAFSAKYSGDNSLTTNAESQTSITSTLYLGSRLWKGASAFINPEIAGGSGLSGALGIAAATNGETFRIGDPAPKIYMARMFFTQTFALSNETTFQASDLNQLAGNLPTKYISVTLGKISISDFFDDNKFSHDPRTQFMSWGLMSNGAWDYPANTRGYTPSFVIEYVTPADELRYAFSLIPTTANGSVMNWNIAKASSQTIEYTHRYKIAGQEGAVRLLGFFTTGNMGNYRQSIALNPVYPNIQSVEKYGNTKYGFGINAEQNLTTDLGCFFKASWNDGNNETWAFTEIDRSASAGLSMTGDKWKRKNDNVGLAIVVSGISKAHQDYLQAGSKGFMLGDGNLNYGLEQLAEIYYSILLTPNMSLSGTYQLVMNPGYNKDRQGPVNVFSARLHIRI